jgi:hypothetical protein
MHIPGLPNHWTNTVPQLLQDVSPGLVILHVCRPAAVASEQLINAWSGHVCSMAYVKLESVSELAFCVESTCAGREGTCF